jgi:hypothetical protein
MVIDLDYYIYDQNSNGLHKYNKTDIHNGKSYDYNLQIYQSQFYIYYIVYSVEFIEKMLFDVDHISPNVTQTCSLNNKIFDRCYIED